MSVAKPHVGDTLKIETSAARRGCFNSALLRVRIQRAVPGPDPVVKSGATRKGRLSLALACKPGTYYATVTDYRGRTAKSRAAKLTCTPGSGTPSPSPTSPTPTSGPSTPPPASGGGVGTNVENEVLRLTNEERAKGGCQPLKHDPQLNKAAHDHSADMASANRMSHTSSDGRDLKARLKDAGFTGARAWAENVAEGYRTPAEVVQGWMTSPGHRKNIMNCGYTLIGVGSAATKSGRLYWTQDFAAK